ncbi:coatomer subunit alpha, partial [Coemansia sp. RSA 2611]
MPARHPLGLQSGAAPSDLDMSLSGELAAQGQATATTTALSRPLPPFTENGPDGSYSANRSEASSVAATVATTEHSQSCCLTPLALGDDDNEDGGFGMAGSASSTAARASARVRTNALSTADTSVSAVAANDIAKCPICLSTICEAFMTACGHSFCYGCISRHLSERQTCPTCCRALTSDQIYPNFALNQLINSHSGETQHPSSSNIVDQIRNSVESNQGLDVGDIDALLLVLQQKKLEMRSFE